MTSHFVDINLYGVDIQILFRIANLNLHRLPTKLLHSCMITCCESTLCYSYYIYVHCGCCAIVVASTKVKEPELQLTAGE